ncbi:Uu.00g139950.m01.CDS01 [Anthostomella pinea]|uniref:Uu.00g139950.m01.CDS01 n=1 Tax=Anthostomella pinea TaxID=933095 RepID=A0AAI8VQT4_9PEZI|nr:Uu.00g139950.m01.CDS01 [Anthostomella pinea]
MMRTLVTALAACSVASSALVPRDLSAEIATLGQFNWTLIESEFIKAGNRSTITGPPPAVVLSAGSVAAVPIAGFPNSFDFGNYATNAPFDCLAKNSHMGCFVYLSGQFNPENCAEACRNATANGEPCRFFNTYMLQKGADDFAQYCSLYAQVWGPAYATNNGQYDPNGNFFGIYGSVGYYNASDLGGDCIDGTITTTSAM